jgi:hypothetical protein
MSDLARFHQLLHDAVYDLTGWALPDEGLRLLAAQVPFSLRPPVTDPSGWERRMRRWCAGHSEAVDAVVQDLQAFA